MVWRGMASPAKPDVTPFTRKTIGKHTKVLTYAPGCGTMHATLEGRRRSNEEDHRHDAHGDAHVLHVHALLCLLRWAFCITDHQSCHMAGTVPVREGASSKAPSFLIIPTAERRLFPDDGHSPVPGKHQPGKQANVTNVPSLPVRRAARRCIALFPPTIIKKERSP